MQKPNELNLVTDPWIKVMLADGDSREVSLLELFENAQSYRWLAGEMATQNIAVLRMLLAVVYTVFSRYDIDGTECAPECFDDAVDRWIAIWRAKCFPMKPIRAYLSQNQKLFNLFDAKRPFLQTPALVKQMGLTDVIESTDEAETTAEVENTDEVEGTEDEKQIEEDSQETGNDKEWIPTQKLNGVLAQSENKMTLFSSRDGENKKTLNYAEAARWLIHAMIYDDKAIKGQKALNHYRDNHYPDPEQRGSTRSVGVGWGGQFCNVYAVGSNLFETLMLNYVLLRDGKEELWPEQHPIWEKGCTDINYLKKEAIPNNPAEMMIPPKRQIILHRKDHLVNGYYISYGSAWGSETDKDVEKQQAYAALVEQMALRRGERNSKKNKKDQAFCLQKPDHAMFIWKCFPQMLVEPNKTDNETDNESRPGVVQWVAKLSGWKDENLFSEDRKITFGMVDLTYKSAQQSAFEDVAQDTITLHASLLAKQSLAMQKKIAEAVCKCNQLAEFKLMKLAKDLDLARGIEYGKSQKKQQAQREQMIKEQFYFRLEQPFRRWLGSLTPQSNMQEKENEWKDTASDIAISYGEELVLAAGPAAFIGRTVTREDKKGKKSITRYTAPEAYSCFCSQVQELYDNSVRRNHMQVPEKSMVYSIVSRKLQSIQNLPDNLAKAVLANLRRGAGKLPGDLPELWGALLADLSEAELNRLCGKTGTPTKAEWAVYTALTTYAVHQQGHDCKTACMNTEEPFGQAVGRLVTPGDEDSLERIRNRFNRIATTQSMDEVSNYLRSLVQLLREKNIGFNYSRLAADLYDFQFPELAPTVRLRWGQAFYRHITKKQEQKKSIGKDETHEKA